MALGRVLGGGETALSSVAWRMGVGDIAWCSPLLDRDVDALWKFGAYQVALSSRSPPFYSNNYWELFASTRLELVFKKAGLTSCACILGTSLEQSDVQRGILPNNTRQHV